MIIYLKLLIVIVLLILAIRIKVGMGLSLMLSSLLLGLLFFPDIKIIPSVFVNSLKSYPTVKTLILVFSVLLLSSAMKEKGLGKMVNGLTGIIPNVKYAIIVPPILLGFLPMPGGAMFPAAIIDTLGASLKLSPEKKTYINYWFRHIWEYFWPLYPGLILTALILKIPIRNLMVSQFYLTILALSIGIIALSGVKNERIEKAEGQNIKKSVLDLTASFFPILIIIIFMLFTRIKEEVILFTVAFSYLILMKKSIKEKLKILVKSATFDTLMLIIGVMLFKDFFNESYAIKESLSSIPKEGFLVYILLVLMPAVLGFITGINQAYVGILLPMVVPFVYTASGGLDMTKVALFYSSGFFGVLLSPVHLCLSLTVDYFKADWRKVYRILIPSALPILIIPLLIHFLLK